MRNILVVVAIVAWTNSCKTSEVKSSEKGFASLNATKKGIYVDSLWEADTATGLVKLSGIRDQLIKKNLVDNYNKYPQSPKCASFPPRYRTYDGTCYTQEFPFAGAAGMRFGRNSSLAASRGENERLTLFKPNPRTVSNNLMARKKFIPATSVNLLAAAWIQFMVHDWFNHEKNPQKKMSFGLEPRNPFGKNTMDVPRTPADRKNAGEENYFTSRNTETAWWDASQIYGSNELKARSLRAGRGGRLRIAKNGLLPLDPRIGQEMTGFTDNWWVGLSIFHHLFVLEHNRIAVMLHSKYPKMSDEELFQKARLINAAVLAKIHTVEWTPAVLQHSTLTAAMNTNWYGLLVKYESPTKYLSSFLPSRLGFLHGIVGLPETRSFGVPYSLTEEFVTVYRMHQFLPDQFTVKTLSNQDIATYGLEAVARKNVPALVRKHGLAQWVYSFGHQNPGALVLNNFPKFLRNIPMTDSMNLDLASVDVLRDRERGVPRYNEFRRQLRLKPVESFDQITDNVEHVAQLRKTYESVEEIDAIVGMLAEGHRPPGFAFGETQFRIFVLMASRRLFSDPFFTRLYNAEHYTAEGLQWVEDATFARVLVSNLPQLASKVGLQDNAFLPWK